MSNYPPANGPAYPTQTHHRRQSSLRQPPPNTFGFGNPGPLGLLAFGTTTFMLSFYNVGIRGITVPNLIVAPAFAYGGLAQLLAGMWEFAVGNTFGGTAFASYGAFWISFGLIFLPSSGIIDAYAATPGMLDDALAIYLIAFFLLTTVFLLACLKTSYGLIWLFLFLDITFLLLAIGECMGANGTTAHKAGGAVGIATAFIAYYNALAGLCTPDSSYFVLPVGKIAKQH